MRGAQILLNYLGCVGICLCGGAVGCGGVPSQPVSITSQPTSQTVPLGQVATFTVTASGTAPLTYQWSENGNAIAGAMGSSYTTPAVSVSDNGAVFSVTVCNRAGTVISDAATLTVGPRSPKAGDLRFQQVGGSTEAEDGTALGQSGGLNLEESGFRAQDQFMTNAVGSPLRIGQSGACYLAPSPYWVCSWIFFDYPLTAGQSGLDVLYQTGLYASFESDLTSSELAATYNQPPPDSPSTVITSLDFAPAGNAYALSWEHTAQGGGFDMEREIVAPGAVEAAVAQDAAQSRVVTAVSFDASAQANLFSYGWQGDTTTVYDTSVTAITAQQEAPNLSIGQAVQSAAETLAGEGYILTAFGGDTTNGFLLIGTKVHGDTLPRPLEYGSCPQGGCSQDYAPVVFFQGSWPDGTGSGDAVIVEK